MKYFYFCFLLLFFNACSVKYNMDTHILNQKRNSAEVQKINNLKSAIFSLSPNVSAEEANIVAQISVLYSLELANQYDLVRPPLFHNTLINFELKSKGFCYDFALDLIKKLKKQNLKTLDLYWAVHEKAQYWEHNSVVVSAKDKTFEEGIVLDAWRDSGNLYWDYVVKDTQYQWHKDVKDSKYYGTIK